MNYIIYKTTKLINGKFYIGKHAQELKPYEFDGYLGSGLRISKSIEKYGKDNFVRETLFVFSNENECYLKEKEILKEFYGKEDCYNLTNGGRGGGSQPKTEEHKERIRKGLKGKIRSKKHRENLSKSLKGIKPTEEQKRKNSESNKKVIKTPEWNKKNSDAHKGISKPQWVREKISRGQ